MSATCELCGEPAVNKRLCQACMDRCHPTVGGEPCACTWCDARRDNVALEARVTAIEIQLGMPAPEPRLTWWDIWGRWLVKCCQRHDYLGACHGTRARDTFPNAARPACCHFPLAARRCAVLSRPSS